MAAPTDPTHRQRANSYMTIESAERVAAARAAIHERYADEVPGSPRASPKNSPGASPKRIERQFTMHRATPVQRQQQSETSPRSSLSTRTVKSISLKNLGELRKGNLKGWNPADRLSTNHPHVLLESQTIELSSNPEAAAAQVAAFFKESGADSSPPSDRLYHLLTNGKDRPPLYDALNAYCESIETESEKFEAFLDELVELSLFSTTLPFVHEICSHLSKNNVTHALAAKLYEAHKDRQFSETLFQFVSEEVKRQKPDHTLFRNATLASALSGIAVREIIKEFVARIMKESPQFTMGDLDSINITFQQIIPQIIGTLNKTRELKELIQKTRVEPLRAHFHEESPETIENCVSFGVIDMVFLRGLCPLLSMLESLDIRKRGFLSKFFLNLVTNQKFSDTEARLNIQMEMHRPQFEEFLNHFRNKLKISDDSANNSRSNSAAIPARGTIRELQKKLSEFDPPLPSSV